MIVAWDYHMQKVFIPYWMSLLDESLYVWMNKSIFLVFFFFPLRPHPKSNKYHTIYCGEIDIIYGWYTAEERDHPIPMVRPEFNTSPNMNRFGIILRITIALWSTGKAVITNISFFFLKSIFQIRKKVDYGSVLIKNRGYWTKGVYGDGIKEYFRSKILVM